MTFMPTTRLVIVDDGQGRWGPVLDMRAVFEIRTGANRTLDRIERVTGLKASTLIVPQPLVDLLRSRHAGVEVNPTRAAEGDWLIVNGRCVRTRWLEMARSLGPQSAVTTPAGAVVAARVRAFDPASPLKLAADVTTARADATALIDRPWQLMTELENLLPDDLNALDLPTFTAGDIARHCPSVVAFGEHPIKIAPSARIQPGSVINASKGIVAIDADALVSPLALLEGPCYLGWRAEVAPGGHVRNFASIGPMCKVGGETSHSILEGYANKPHHGYLGQAYVGKWANLGAETNVSNLKNTYGQIRVQLDNSDLREDTGRQFLGPVIGDFVRTAIGTRLLTGAVVATGSMLAVSSFAPTFVDRFRFITDKGNEPAQIDKLIATAHAMMARRDCKLTPQEEARLRALAGESR